MENSQNTKSSISVTIRKKSYNRELTSRAIKHNFRLGYQQSVDPDKSKNAYLYDPTMPIGHDGLLSFSEDLSEESKEKTIDHFMDKYDEIDSYNKTLLDDRNRPENRNNFYKTNGRFKGYWAYKHDLVGEGVVHIQTDGADDFQFKKNPEVAQAVLENINEWMTMMKLRPVENLQFHGDEKGLPHVHFLYWRSNTETGKAVHPNKQQLSLLQTMIAKGMEKFGFHRATPWSQDATRKRRHEDVFEFKQRQELEQKQIRFARHVRDAKMWWKVNEDKIEKAKDNFRWYRDKSKEKKELLDNFADQVAQKEKALDQLSRQIEVEETFRLSQDHRESRQYGQIGDVIESQDYFFKTAEGVSAINSITERANETLEELMKTEVLEKKNKLTIDRINKCLALLSNPEIRAERIEAGFNRLDKILKAVKPTSGGNDPKKMLLASKPNPYDQGRKR